MSEWIPITVSQPKPLVDVLVTAVESGTRRVYTLCVGRDGRWLWPGADVLFDAGRVTHWMPMPEPAR